MDDTLEAMRRNPAGDLAVADVERVCRRFGATMFFPRGGGSYIRVSHPSQRMILTVQARRPIKPVYIRKPAVFLEAVGGTDADL